MIYRARRLIHAYGGRKALGPCSFVVPEGSRFAVVGPNGSGKTTLAEILVGLMMPASGELRFFGSPMRLPLARRVRARLGYMAQQPCPLPGEVFTNLVLVASRGRSRSDAERTVRGTLERLKIDHLGDRVERSLSVGQLRLVVLARALVRRPAVLILDEPLAFVDEAYGGTVMAAIEAHSISGGTVVMTSPRPAEVAGWATDILDLGAPIPIKPVARLRGAG